MAPARASSSSSIGKSTSKKDDKADSKSCCALFGSALHEIFVVPLAWLFSRTVCGKSVVGDDFGATFNFIVAYILFFAIGLPAYMDYGYDDNTKPAADGAYKSGPLGTGSFIITSILFIVANIIWLVKMYYNCTNNALMFRAERAAAIAQAESDAQLAEAQIAAKKEAELARAASRSGLASPAAAAAAPAAAAAAPAAAAAAAPAAGTTA